MRTSVAHNAERDDTRDAAYSVPSVALSIKSDITPETLDVIHYPGSGRESHHPPQVHFHIREGISGHSIYLREEDALLIRDFLNEFYPSTK